MADLIWISHILNTSPVVALPITQLPPRMGKASPLWLHETPRDPSQATRELGEAGKVFASGQKYTAAPWASLNT